MVKIFKILFVLIFMLPLYKGNAQHYNHNQNGIFGASLSIDDSLFSMSYSDCSSETIGKGRVICRSDTLILISDTMTLPRLSMDFMPIKDSLIIIKVFDIEDRPWNSLSLIVGGSNTNELDYDNRTDHLGCFEYKNDKVRFVIPTFIYESYNISNPMFEEYFISNFKFGIYTIKIYEQQHFAFDRNTQLIPPFTTRLIIKGDQLYDVDSVGQLYEYWKLNK